MEATRGTAIAATKKLYGVLEPTWAQPHIWAADDRGSFVDKYRGNLKTVEAGFTFSGDSTFEDQAFWLSLHYNGAAAPTGSALLGYTTAVAPDSTSDTLKTMTIETGDNTVAWQGCFGTVDTADYTLGLDDTLKVKYGGWVQNWIAQSADPTLTTSFTGFTAAIPDRVVEGVSGMLNKLYIDVAGGTPGTTQMSGRFISATFSYHNQNARKYFGDGSAVFTKLGRGRRQTMATITFEGTDTVQWALMQGNAEAVVRLGLTGIGIAGSTGPIYKAQYFDFWGIWDTFKIGARDTNTTWEMDLQAIYDITAAHESMITSISAQSTV